MSETAGLKILVAARRACRKYHARWCPSRRAPMRVTYKVYCKRTGKHTGYVAATLKARSNRKYPLCTKLFHEVRIICCERRGEKQWLNIYAVHHLEKFTTLMLMTKA